MMMASRTDEVMVLRMISGSTGLLNFMNDDLTNPPDGKDR